MARAPRYADIGPAGLVLELRQLPSQQVEQQPVMPRAILPPLVGSHDAHRAEANTTICSDGALVRRRRVDRQAVVRAHVEEVARQGTESVGAKALALVRRSEAAEAGFYDSPWGRHPRIQLRTIRELLDGQGLDYPHVTGANVTHRRTARVRPEAPEALGLFAAEDPTPYDSSDSN